MKKVTQLDLSELHNRQLITTRTCKNYAVKVFCFFVSYFLDFNDLKVVKSVVCFLHAKGFLSFVKKWF